MLTPLKLRVLLDIYTGAQREHSSPAHKQAITSLLIEHGVIQPITDVSIAVDPDEGYCGIEFETTEKGNAWVRAILQTNEPVRAWVDSEGKVL